MEYYSVLKRKEMLTHAATWTNPIPLSSHRQKAQNTEESPQI